MALQFEIERSDGSIESGSLRPSEHKLIRIGDTFAFLSDTVVASNFYKTEVITDIPPVDIIYNNDGHRGVPLDKGEKISLYPTSGRGRVRRISATQL